MRVRHHTSDLGLAGIKKMGCINVSRGWGDQPAGIHVELGPFGTTRPYRDGQPSPKADFGLIEDGAYVEFDVPTGLQLLEYSCGRERKSALIATDRPLALAGLGPVFIKVRRRVWELWRKNKQRNCMGIRLEKSLLLRLYCYLYQAERSIAFALGAPDWTELLDYYRGERLSGLLALRNDIQALLATHGLPPSRAGREEVAALIRWPSAFGRLLNWLLGRWKRSWTCPEPALAFMSSTLGKLIDVLESGVRPDNDAIISLRMDLCYCRSAIEAWASGMREIPRANWLEHFWQADWIRPVRLEEIVGRPTLEMIEPRKSA